MTFKWIDGDGTVREATPEESEVLTLNLGPFNQVAPAPTTAANSLNAFGSVASIDRWFEEVLASDDREQLSDSLDQAREALTDRLVFKAQAAAQRAVTAAGEVGTRAEMAHLAAALRDIATPIIEREQR